MEKGHILIIGASNSGKSFLCNYLIQKCLNNIYDLIILISGSLNSITDNNIFSSIPAQNKCNNLSDKVLKRITDYVSKHKDKKILIVLDDLNKMLSANTGTPSQKELARQSVNNIQYIFTEGRHNNIYACCLIQYYKQLPPTIRTNARYQIITFANTPTIEAMYDYVSNSFRSLQEFKEYVYEKNVPYRTIIDEQGKEKSFMTSILFDCHSRTRDIKKNVMFIRP